MTLKSLILALVFAPLLAQAGPILHGEWESSGDEPINFTPDYRYKYECQLEATDKVMVATKTGKLVTYYGVAQFSFDNENQYIDTTKLEWKKVAKAADNETVVPGSLPYFKAPHKVALSVSGLQDPQEGDVTLSLTMALPLADQFVVQNKMANFKRASNFLELENWTYSMNADDTYHNNLTMRLICEKKL